MASLEKGSKLPGLAANMLIADKADKRVRAPLAQTKAATIPTPCPTPGAADVWTSAERGICSLEQMSCLLFRAMQPHDA